MLSAVMFALLLQVRFQSPSCTAGEEWEFVVRGRDVDRSPRWPETQDALLDGTALAPAVGPWASEAMTRYPRAA
jgi:hypothetical protein